MMGIHSIIPRASQIVNFDFLFFLGKVDSLDVGKNILNKLDVSRFVKLLRSMIRQ